MEYVPDSLDKHIRAGQPLPYQRAVEIAVQVCRALSHAHEMGVVHRDIKPQNILLTEDGTAKVTDFGIARALVSSTQSRGTRTMGTPWYMSLEQWSGSRVDGRADLYSLGILLYEMLTGSVPFQGEAIEAIYVQHRESRMPRMPQNLRIPRTIEDVVRKAIEKRPEDRFANANAMCSALEGALTRSVASDSRPGQGAPAAPSRTRQQPSPVVGGKPRRWTPKTLTLGAIIGVTLVVIGAVVAIVLPLPGIVGKEVVIEKEVPVQVIVEKEVLVEKEVIKEVPVEVIVEKEVVREVVTKVPVTVMVTATPPPLCAQVSQSNRLWFSTTRTYTIYYRVTNVCHRPIKFAHTIVLFGPSGNMINTESYRGTSHIRPGRSHTYKNDISHPILDTKTTYEISLDWVFAN
jgi:hypothetical protein